MTGSRDILRTLSRLSPTDRDWLIEQLPAQDKTRLLSLSGEWSAGEPASAPTVATSMEPAAEVASLRHAAPTVLVDCLQKEPAWFIVALLRAQTWPWREELLAALPSSLRAEVERGMSGIDAFTPRLTEALLRIVAARAAAHVMPRPASKFESLVEKLAAARSRKRWSIHL